MKKEPSYTPKYWAGHDSRTDDLIVGTMFKYRQDTHDHMALLYGEDWEDTHPHLQIDLVELLIVQR